MNDTDYWIGARSDTNGGHTYHWVDGSTLSYLTYNNWGNNLMGEFEIMHCLFLSFVAVCMYVTVNNFGHVETVSSLIFLLGKLFMLLLL